MNRTPLVELAAALHWRVVAVVITKIGYFDDSGTHKGSAVATLAGYVGRVADWGRLESQWLYELEPFKDKGLKTFHMYECRTQTGDCARLETWECEHLVTRLSNILEQAHIKAFWSAVDVRDWDAITTPLFRETCPKPYDLCFQSVLREILSWQKNWGEEGEPIALVFAVQNEYEKRSTSAFHAWQRDNQEVFTSLTYAYPKHYPALQAADMLANVTYGEWASLQTEGPTPRNHFGYDPLLSKITARHSMETGGLYDYRALVNIVRDHDRQHPSSRDGDGPA